MRISLQCYSRLVSFASERALSMQAPRIRKWFRWAVNEVIPFSLLFLCHLFLVAVLGMRSSGMADGSRPSVTTINYPDAIFARAMEKLLARLVMCTLGAHTLAHIYALHTRQPVFVPAR